MSTITTRAGKGSPLTNNEVDANFTNLNTDKAELSGATFTGEIVANAGIALGDNDKATFGAGDDLQIYHDGSASYVKDVGTGDLILQGTNIQLRSASTKRVLQGIEAGAAKIFYDNSEKLATTSTGIDVTGTATMDGLVVGDGHTIGNDGFDNLLIEASSGEGIRLVDNHATNPLTVDSNVGFRVQTILGTDRFFVDNATGDISFYEDTGTTPKLFWDASAERLGIGTSSPDKALTISASDSQVRLYDADGTNQFASFQSDNGIAKITSRNNTSHGQIAFQTYNGTAVTERLRIDSSGRVGIGTSSPDTLLEVVGADPILTVRDTETSGALTNATLRLAESGASDTLNNYWDINFTNNSHLRFVSKIGATTAERMRIDSSGNVGIGTSSPDTLVNIASSSAPTIRIENTDTSLSAGQVVGALEFFTNDPSGKGPNVTGYIETRAADSLGAGGEMVFATGATGSSPEGERAIERLRIDSSGKVGIGASSIDGNSNLQVQNDSGNALLRLRSGTSNLAGVDFGDSDDIDIGGIRYSNSSNHMQFNVNASEAMRIDSSGNVLVGTTDANPYNNSAGSTVDNGFAFGSGALQLARYNDAPLLLNRTGANDGDIQTFWKSGVKAGSIGVTGGDLYIDGAGGQVKFYISGANEYEMDGSQFFATTDNANDLGAASFRWDDIYATNGTIQTSDFNEKQDIAELSDAEQRVAVAAKGLLRKFRWKDSVAEKGDDARIHFGIIAQDLQAAFAAEGLDAGDYAMFISTTWTDEETNEEKTRLGVRYSELLAFIISAL